jgi:hypothetical protein
MSTTSTVPGSEQALHRLERAVTISAQALARHHNAPLTRTSEEWLLAFAANLTELLRAASRYLDTAQSAPVGQAPPGVPVRSAIASRRATPACRPSPP